MEAIRRILVPGGRAIFATPISVSNEGLSGAVFVGKPELCAWWVPTIEGFVRMCEVAGFANVQFVDSFELGREHGLPVPDRIGVIHCERSQDT
jgi:hypothetical protein